MPPPNAHDPLRTTDPAPASDPATPPETVSYGPVPGETRDGPPAAPSEPPPPSIPGYEIESVLGRGGMGVVYKARHLALKRTVALKMVLAGGHAGPRELARFRIEAEAAARLQHPNIVQIHEVGEADGHPYCALEFVEGGNLAGRTAGKPMPVRDAARLVETLARAMQLAHSRNVVHRDLKPANVLLAADGTPKIADFGLARRLDSDSGETQAGQVMGTPSYMAPEQASGQAHEAGPAADVYALGAILYECLTGRPPFKGKTVVETLDQVRTQEPVPPSRGQRSVPPDLETICLKCLRKEPEKRYASAAELADDLGRFLRGEPVQARPVGRLERGWRWCRRNPVLAAAAATVVAALATASVVSTLFGVDAGNKEAAAVAARNALQTKNAELEQSKAEIVKANTQLEGALAETWLTPLAEGAGPLNDAEIGALTGLASAGNDRLTERFLTEALGSRQGMRKLRSRSVFTLHGLVGLDARKRAEIERRLVSGLERTDLADESRTDLALAASTLGGLSQPTASRVAQRLLQALTRTNELLQALTRTNESNEVLSLAQGLSDVASCLDPREAAATLTQAMTGTNGPGALRELARGLSAASARLEPREAVATLTQALKRTNDLTALVELAQGLSAQAPRMQSREAAQAVAGLTDALTLKVAATQTDDAKPFDALTLGLTDAAAQLDARDAAETAAALTTALGANTHDDGVQLVLAQGLSATAARLEPREAAAALALAMTKTPNPDPLTRLAQGLSAAAARMEPREAAAVSAQAAATLMQAMIERKRQIAVATLAEGLSAAAAHMEPSEAASVSARAFSIVIDTVTNAWAADPKGVEAFARGLSAAAAHMEPGEAARACAKAMAGTKNSAALQSLAKCLAAVTARLEPREAAATLTQAMIGVNDRAAVESLAQGLSAAAARVQPEEGARLYGEAADAFSKAMTKAKDRDALGQLAMCLSATAVRMEPRQGAATLMQALSQPSGPFGPPELAAGLTKAAARMDAQEAAAMLTQATTRTTDGAVLAIVKQGVAAAAARREKEVVPASAQAAALTQAMDRTNDRARLQGLARGLSDLAPRLQPDDASKAAAAFTQAMSRTNDPYALAVLAQCLSAVAARMEPREAARVSAEAAAVLLPAMGRTNDPTALSMLADGLSALLGDGRRLERTLSTAAAVGCLDEIAGPSGALALLEPAAEPFPRRLSDQELVELLKQPLCVGPARRAVLDHLEYRYGRPFADQWDFVRFAEEQKLGLDFTRPRQRP